MAEEEEEEEKIHRNLLVTDLTQEFITNNLDAVQKFYTKLGEDLNIVSNKIEEKIDKYIKLFENETLKEKFVRSLNFDQWLALNNKKIHCCCMCSNQKDIFILEGTRNIFLCFNHIRALTTFKIDCVGKFFTVFNSFYED